MNVVAFEPAYAEAVVGLILPIQQQEFGIPVSREDQPDLADIPRFYQRGSGGFWVALHGTEPIGTVGLLDIGRREAALRKMFVKAEYRGAARGVAQALLAVLFAQARAQGLERIFLGTTAMFHAAHRFYEKNGFREIPRSALPAAFPVMKVDTKFYVAAVAP